MKNAYVIKYEIAMALRGHGNVLWRDVTADQIGTPKYKGGIDGNGPLDRVASTGTLSFTLRNVNNKYTPNHASRVYDLTSGCLVRLTFAYQGRIAITKFYGFIPPDGINVRQSPNFNTIKIEAADFMEHLANHELELPAYTTSKRMDEISPLIMANLHVQPLSTSYGTGQDTFATVFDTVKPTTRAITEFNKLAITEMGYVYVKPTTTSDEVLTTEGRKTRNGVAYAIVYVWDNAVSSILTEAGDHLLTEAGDRLLIENVFVATYPEFTTSDAGAFDITHAANYYNAVKTNVYPRRTGTPGEVLYNLERPILITAGSIVYLTGRFKDPNQEAQSVSGINMTDPVATTDYLMNSAEDGSGSNMTANLTVAATYGVNGVDYTLTNTHGATTGYVTLLQARGTGVYTYRQAERLETDTALVNAEGKRMLTVNMSYQDNPLVGTDFAVYLLSQHKEKLTTIEAVSFIANKSPFLMNAFLDVNIGSKIHINESGTGINRAFFVNSIEFVVLPGGQVNYSWGLKDSLYDTFEAWTLGVSQLDVSTILGF